MAVATQLDVGSGLVVRRSRRRQLPALLLLAGFFVAYVIGGVTGVLTAWILALGLAVFGLAVTLLLVEMARSGAGSAPLLRVRTEGVEVYGARTVPWSEFAGVRVSRMRPRWLFPFSLGYHYVTFLPQPGVSLPKIGVRTITEWLGVTSSTPARLWGSEMVLATATTTVTADQVADAVDLFGHVPIHRG